MTHDGAVRRGWTRVADAGLAIAAVLGAVCIVLAVAAVLFDVRIVMFRTGSMSPTIPAGSAAVVHGIPASDIRVGDVVMVERAGQLPVTHRVVGVERIPGADDARSIRMRGDANAVDDPMPYEVTEVRRVVLAVPGVAPVLVALGSPWVMGALTIAATALIVVVFWPRRRRDGVEPDGPSGHVGDAPPPGSRRARRAAGIGAAVALLLSGGSVTAVPSPAHAESGIPETVTEGEVIRLVSIEDPAMRSLTPGRTAVWQVGVTADAATPGTITVTLAGTGEGADGLRLEVQGCPQRWQSAQCPAPSLLVSDSPVPTAGVPQTLRTMPADAQLWLRLAVSMPSDAQATDSELQLTVRATGAGDDVSTAPGDVLAVTGGAAGTGLIGAGAVLVAIGIGAILRLRRRS